MPKYYTGKEYLQIEIATHMGLDKKLFEDRIAWVNMNEHQLEELENKADDYFRYAAAVMAYRIAQKGIPSGYLVGLDACASGPQILSTLTGCKVGAENTGATGQTRKDVYGLVASEMNRLLDEDTHHDRADVKAAFMPHFYASMAEPKRIYGEGTPELAAFYKATDIVCPGANRLLPDILGLWNPEALSYAWDLPDGFKVICKVKETHETKIEVDTIEGHPTFLYRHVVNTEREKGLFLPANITHSVDGYIVRELTARCDYNIDQLEAAKIELIRRLQIDIEVSETAYLYAERMWHKHNAISIEGVEFVNYWSVNQMSKSYCEALLKLIREVIKKPAFRVITVHDEFQCLPNNMNYVRQEYINILAELADSTTLNAILSDVAKRPITIKKMSTDLSTDIRNAEYPLA